MQIIIWGIPKFGAQIPIFAKCPELVFRSNHFQLIACNILSLLTDVALKIVGLPLDEMSY